MDRGGIGAFQDEKPLSSAQLLIETYRWMFEHMRAAFGHPAVIGTATGTVHVGQLPDMSQQQQPQGGQPGGMSVPPPHAEGEGMETDSGEGNVAGGESHEGDPDESE